MQTKKSLRKPESSKDEFISLLSQIRLRLSEARYECIRHIQSNIEEWVNRDAMSKEDFGKMSGDINEKSEKG